MKFILVDKHLHNYTPLINAIRSLKAEHVVPLITPGDESYEVAVFRELSLPAASGDGKKAERGDVILVTARFEGRMFDKLCGSGYRVVAPPLIIRSAMNSEPMLNKPRPLYCAIMDKLIVCFGGFRVRDELSRLADLVHRMGGSIRKDFTSTVTHLVSSSTCGEKYRTAVGLGTQIMSVEWIEQCWSMRDDYNVHATDEVLVQEYKLRPFSFSSLCFVGFSEERKQHMHDVTCANGGTLCSIEDTSLTHIVVNERTTKSISFEPSSYVYIVKSEWFWASIQMEACADESLYFLEDPVGTSGDDSRTPGSTDGVEDSSNTTAAGKKTPKTLSGSKSHRRKRLRENLAQLATGGEADRSSPAMKRKSEGGEGMPRRSLSTSFLDATVDTSVPLADLSSRENAGLSPTGLGNTNHGGGGSKLTARQLTILELLNTEKNYVNILHTIIQVFREEIDRADQPGGPILDALDSREIFGGIAPIYEVHCEIREELSMIVAKWAESSKANQLSQQLVGDIFIRHKEALSRCYPNFINYFEKTKEVIQRCDRTKPRFHAFLRLCEGKPECGRQTLTELLIRPVQRLPSVMILLKDIRRRTDKGHADLEKLDTAIKALEEVMTHINEDKLKAEGHQFMFEIINDIENCPPSLLSAHRTFIRQVDVVEVTNELSKRGDHVCLLVFSDCLEICKRRGGRMKTGGVGGGSSMLSLKGGARKQFKHLSLIPLSAVKRIVDICDTPECRNVFAVVVKRIEDQREKLYSFALLPSTLPDVNQDLKGGAFNQGGAMLVEGEGLEEKEELLTSLSKAVCTITCRTDYETLLATVESDALNLDTSDLSAATSSHSLTRVANRFSRRLSRVFSINVTPQTMKRTLSSLTPSSLRRESSTFNLLTAPLPLPAPATPQRPATGGVAVRAVRGRLVDDEVSLESDCYSEIIDQMSLGTPSVQRRRETLAGISLTDVSGTLGTPKMSGDGVFVTPRPVRPLPRSTTPLTSGGEKRRWFGSLRRDTSSQSLYNQSTSQDGITAHSRTPSSSSFAVRRNKEWIP